jgi:uncharacterized protein (DUF1810 family)
MRMDDPFNLQRFIDAQAGGTYERALAEISEGAKRSHWMWFIFPQHRDLGKSTTALVYGLQGHDEARAYAAHPLLGARLRDCARTILPQLGHKTAEAILGPVDALKLRSCMLMFSESVPEEPLFAQVLAAATA